MAKKLPVLEFSAVVIRHRGKDVLMIKKQTSDTIAMKHILNEIIGKGSYDFVGRIIFTNRFNALITLRKRGLLS